MPDISFYLFNFMLHQQSMITNKESIQNQFETKKHNSFKLFIVYFGTVLGKASFMGLIGMFAMVKDPLSVEYGLDQAYLGFVDGATFFSNSMGLVFLLFYPSSRPKRDYFINCLVVVATMSLIPLCTFFKSLAEVVVLGVFLISGVSRAFNFTPYLIATQYFDVSGTDKAKFELWDVLASLGDVLALIITSILIHNLSIDWKICYAFGIAIFLITSSLVFFTTQEVQMNDSGRPNQTGQETQGYELVEGAEEQPNQEGGWCGQSFTLLKAFLARQGNLLWILDNGFNNSIYYIILLWMPYYLVKIELENDSAFIAATLNVMMIPSIFLFGALADLIPRHKSFLNLTLRTLRFLSMLGLAILPKNPQNVAFLYIFMALFGFFMGWPIGFTMSTQFKLRTQSNDEMYIVLVASKAVYQLFAVLGLIICGTLIKQNPEYYPFFLTLLCLIGGLLFAFRILRARFFETKSYL